MSRRTLLVLLFFFGSGCAALAYEVVWIRLLSLTLSVTVYSLTTVLCAFMAGLPLGAAIATALVDRLRYPLVAFGLAELGIGICGDHRAGNRRDDQRGSEQPRHIGSRARAATHGPQRDEDRSGSQADPRCGRKHTREDGDRQKTSPLGRETQRQGARDGAGRKRRPSSGLDPFGQKLGDAVEERKQW